MLTAGEMVAVQAALDRADAAVRASWVEVEKIPLVTKANAYVKNMLGMSDPYNSAEDAALSAGALVSGLYRTRDAAIESPDYEHEMAIEIVDIANRLSGTASYSGKETTATAVRNLGAQLNLGGAGGQALATKTQQVASAAWQASLKTLQIVGIGILVLVAVVAFGKGRSLWREARS